MNEKIMVDVSKLTLGDMAEAADVAGDPERPGYNFRQAAALAWVSRRQTDPTFTYDDALRLRNDEFEVVEQPPEVPGAANGATPQGSPVSGVSTLPTS